MMSCIRCFLAKCSLHLMHSRTFSNSADDIAVAAILGNEHRGEVLSSLSSMGGHLYRFSVEWHMQFMHWFPPKFAMTDFSSALWYFAATAEPPPSVLPDRPTPAWQSTLTPVMPAQTSQKQSSPQICCQAVVTLPDSISLCLDATSVPSVSRPDAPARCACPPQFSLIGLLPLYAMLDTAVRAAHLRRPGRSACHCRARPRPGPHRCQTPRWGSTPCWALSSPGQPLAACATQSIHICIHIYYANW